MLTSHQYARRSSDESSKSSNKVIKDKEGLRRELILRDQLMWWKNEWEPHLSQAVRPLMLWSEIKRAGRMLFMLALGPAYSQRIDSGHCAGCWEPVLFRNTPYLLSQTTCLLRLWKAQWWAVYCWAYQNRSRSAPKMYEWRVPLRPWGNYVNNPPAEPLKLTLSDSL